MADKRKPSPADANRAHRTGPIGRVVGKTIGATAATAGSLIRPITGLHRPRLRKPKPGTAPGIELDQLTQLPTSPEPVYVSCIDYCPDHVQMQEVTNLDEFLAVHRPEWSAVRWINVDGLTDMRTIQSLAQKYQLHPLAIEDLLHVPQRPKVDSYANQGEQLPRLFVVARMIQLIDDHLKSEQVSMFLGRKTVLTFQETHGDVWDPIRNRINKPGSRLRGNDASFLINALLDAAVDHCFPVLEHFGDRLDELEEAVLENPHQQVIHQIHLLRRELLLLRREVWPMREVINTLYREPHECMADNTRTYLRDVYDHAVQILEIVETYREMATGLAETYMSAMGNRMNEVMKVLAIFAAIFIPLSFLAGVFGMNFDEMPLLHQPWGFWVFAALCVTTGVGMLGWFKRRGWL